jgi:oligopeptide transport system substrate-binding protein
MYFKNFMAFIFRLCKLPFLKTEEVYMTAIHHILEEITNEESSDISFAFHPTFYSVYEKAQKWLVRFPQVLDKAIFNDIFLFYLLATKEYLDHRTPSHLFRLILSLHVMQKKLLRAEIFTPNQRDLKVRWISTNLLFPFASKPVLGCLIGFNLASRYELFDEENILLALQKHLPQLRLVRESSYRHTSQRGNLKTFYLEIEKKDGTHFSCLEQSLLKNNLEEKFKNSIQTLSPSIFMRVNEEEVYKHILVLSQEIQSIQDLPQAYITLDRQTGKEIVFRVSLVFISPLHRFSLKERLFDCTFVSERISPVRNLDGHSIQAHIFRISMPRDPSVLRSDGSLDFYSARKKVGALMTSAIGEFRDYNGGILIKQQELLDDLKDNFPEIAEKDLELMDSFFYAITPLEKQVLLNPQILFTLFKHFLETYQERLPSTLPYTLKIIRTDPKVFITVRGDHAALTEIVSETLQGQAFRMLDLAYNIVNIGENAYFNCVLIKGDSSDGDLLVQGIQDSLHRWHQKLKQRQILRIALEYAVVSLDPRIGGEAVSGDILHFLFEGLTRFNQDGVVENGIAESIEISPNLRQYIFKLRSSFWNNGYPVSAYDFEYAWKKILAPDFKTAFADHFYHIKNAKQAKEGKCSLSEVGIEVIDDRTLKVELVRPTPYFLQLTAHHLFSPVHRLTDQQYPQWPYQSEKNYPCNGPFQLKINQPTQGYQFVRNPLYWQAERVKLDQVILTVMNSSQAIQAFQKKEVDWVGNPFGGWHSSYNPGKGDRIIRFSNSWIVWNAFNTQMPPFNNLKVRQGFNYAIQRSDIVEKAFMPLNPAYNILLPHYPEKRHSLFPEYNPKMAVQLFNEGLQELGMQLKDLPPIKITFLEKGIREYTAVCLKKQFEQCLGITCELQPLSWRNLFNKMSSGDFQMGLMHWTSWVDDPIYTLNVFKSKDVEINFAKWQHPKFQHLLNLGQHELNLFQRSCYLLEAEELLSQEMPVLPIFYQPCQALVNEDLHVIYRAPSGPFNAGRSFYK